MATTGRNLGVYWLSYHRTGILLTICNPSFNAGDQLLSATVYFDNVSYQDAIQILEHAQAYKVKLCLKRKPDITETEPFAESDIIPVTLLSHIFRILCCRLFLRQN